ncbi:MAG: sugar nucleotide-binding protein [Candidatus Latescibacterota bacterium]|nr:sugar nucleotide-binding protein [Candidatus Latescibacterota bacterium]
MGRSALGGLLVGDHPATLLFGGTSIVGYGMARRFPQVSPFVPPGSKHEWPALDLETPAWLESLFSEHEPELLIYCHAVCNVLKCEQNPDWAHKINVRHIHRLLDALPTSTRLVYVSSDHVFGGNGVYDEDAGPCPISVYGQTRVEAESLILGRSKALVLRAGLAIGPSHDGRTGHRDWLAYRHRRDLPITIIEDEARSAVWVSDLADRIMQFALSPETGLRHLAATRAVSRVELAQFLGRHLGISPNFNTSSRHQQPAPHLGYVELATLHSEPLNPPLPSVLDAERI